MFNGGKKVKKVTDATGKINYEIKGSVPGGFSGDGNKQVQLQPNRVAV